MNALFEIRPTNALQTDLQRILLSYRTAASKPTDTARGVAEAMLYERQLVRETIAQIWSALERAQTPALDAEVLGAMQRLQASIPSVP